ncbi:MAG TPA: alpha/beta hydrolase [Candidatus Deferrimicrobiaceae bacterium]
MLLHEGLGCVAMWRDFPARLAARTGCGVLAYSRLGYGGSDPCDLPRPLDYMHTEGRTVLTALLDAAGVRDCVVVGHSDGGSIALIHAGDTPAEPVRGVVTFAAHVFCEELSVRSIAAARDAYTEGDLRARLARYHGANVDCAFWGWNRAWLDPGFLAWNIEEHLPAVAVPALVVQGADDPYGTLRQVEAIERQSGGPVRRCILDRCGHSPHRDRRDETLSAMAAFVRELPGPEKGS